MRYRRGRFDWYDPILIGLAALIVYPDVVLNWIGDRIGRTFGWIHLVLLEVAAIGSMIGLTAWLMPQYPRLQWWYPLLFVGVFATFRALRWLINQLFGFDD